MTISVKADQWYRTLTPHQRIFLKESFVDVVGFSWSDVGALFSLRERIALYHRKLTDLVIPPCG